jgi:DNA polymerase-3 subunit gamma/tau
MNVLEIDGASNNSVDDVRELREVVRYVPTEGAYRIFIIDEIHMLSTAAFNALLKTLEEPPERVIFVFATTEVQEVPETILSRCQRFNFRRISAARMVAQLVMICQEENIAADEAALFLLADRADGALRDAQSLLDQVASFNEAAITTAGVQQVLGLVDRTLFFDLGKAFHNGDARQTLALISQLVDAGGDIEEFVHGLVEYLRHLLYVGVQGSAATLEVAESDRPHYEEMASLFAAEDLLRMLQGAMDLSGQLRHSGYPRFRVEMALIRMTLMARAVDVSVLLDRLTALEKTLKGQMPKAVLPSSTVGTAVPVKSAPATVVTAKSTASVQSASTAASEVETAKSVSSVDVTEPSDLQVVPPMTEPVDTDKSAVLPPAETLVETEVVAAKQEAAALPVSATGTIDLTVIKSVWGQLVQQVRQKQPTLGIFLQGAVLLGVDEQNFKLGFATEDRFPMSQVLKHRAVVEEWCLQQWGQRLRLKCVVQDSMAEDNAPGALIAPAPAADDNVKAVLDTFDGELL